MDTVIRFDRGKMMRRPQMQDGRLRFDSIVTRVGVFEYRDERTGNIRRELRHPDQVFHPKHLRSIGGAPQTLHHPPVMLKGNDEAYQKYAVGVVGDEIDATDRQFVKVYGSNVLRGDAITAISNGTQEQSLGYLCRVVAEEGDWHGIPYTHRQYGIPHKDGEEWIDVDHNAIVDLARAGRNARIHFDSEELSRYDSFAFQLDDFDQRSPIILTPSSDFSLPRIHSQVSTPSDLPPETTVHSTHNKKMDQEEKLPLRTIKVDEDSYKIPVDAHYAITSKLKADAETIVSLQKQLDSLKTTAEGLQPKVDAADSIQSKLDELGFDSFDAVLDELQKQIDRADAAEAARDQYKEDLTKAQSQKNDAQDIDERVNARLALISRVMPFLPKDFKFDGLSDRQIHEAVISSNTSLKADALESRSDGYVEARCDAVIESGVANEASTKQPDELDQVAAGLTDSRSDSADPEGRSDAMRGLNAARQKRLERIQANGKQLMEMK